MQNAELEGDTFARPNKLRNRKHLQANALVLLRLFLLSPKSFLRNTFRGAPIAALYVIIASSQKRTRCLMIPAVGMTCLFVILSLSKYLKQATERTLDLRSG